MTDLYTWDFTVEVVIFGNNPDIDDTVKVGCAGVGSAGDKTFHNGQLVQHWRELGIRWHDDHGTLVMTEVTS
jgi:hypothetical protein